MLGMLRAVTHASELVPALALPEPELSEWRERFVCLDKVRVLAEELGVSEILARLVCLLGIEDVRSADRFLNPKLAHLGDPFKLTNLRKAVDRLIAAIHNQESAVIIGDYDVDGVTSIAFFVTALKGLGLNAKYLVPRRMEEGYGLSHAIVDRALEETPKLLIALDCGTTAVQEVAFVRSKSVDVIIIDHHRSKEGLPADCILVNPHVMDTAGHAWGNLCTVGLVFKLFHGLIKALKEAGDPKGTLVELKDYLDFVALGTVADLVPLQGENRILTRFGLKRLGNSVHPGVRALFDASGLQAGQDVHPSDIAFRLGPRINASGRLADATLPLEMLLSDNYERAYESASELNTLNRERQAIERKVSEVAQMRAESTSLANISGHVLFDPQWHSGVVGIVAGKLARKFQRPCIVMGCEGGLAKGSGRSIPGVNLIEVLGRCKDYLASWGGHPMAVGVSLPIEAVEAFSKAFVQAVADVLPEDAHKSIIEIAAWLRPELLQEGLLHELDLMRPFGEGNPEPIFGIQGARLSIPPSVFGQEHYRFQLPTSHGIMHGVAWNKADTVMPADRDLDLAVRFRWNIWNGRRYPQIELVEWRSSGASGLI